MRSEVFDQSKLKTATTNRSEPISIEAVSRISIPFGVAGGLYLFCALSMLLCWLVRPYVPPERSLNGKDVQLARKRIDAADESLPQLLLPSRKFYAIFVCLAVAFAALEGLAEYQYLYLTPIFLDDYLRLSNDQRTTILVLLGAAYIVGRGLNVLIGALQVSVTKTICLNILLLFAGSGLILFISPASDNRSTLTGAAVILLSLGYSSLLPGTKCTPDLKMRLCIICLLSRTNEIDFFTSQASMCLSRIASTLRPR